MRLKKILLNKKSSLWIFFHTDYNPKDIKRANMLLDIFLNAIHFNPQIGYAGFSTKESLRKHLKFLIFGRDYHEVHFKQSPSFPFRKDEMLSNITSILKKCLSQLPVKSIWIFVFPTFDPFIKNKMGGIGAFVPWRHTILLTIHPKAKRWKEKLPDILAHEFNHSIRFRYFPLSSTRTLLDIIISEGLADNFSRQVGGEINPWATAISLKQVGKIFNELRKSNLLNTKFNKKGERLYHALFFGNRKYPLWAGYSIGYQIVKNFLKNNKYLNWGEIIKLESKEILKQSGFN